VSRVDVRRDLRWLGQTRFFSRPKCVATMKHGPYPPFACMGHRVEFAIIVCHLWSFERQRMIGTRIAEPTIMKFFCKHCDQIVIGKPYRVVSEDNGVILLNMTVCGSCHEQAKALGLHSEAIKRDSYGREKSLFFRSPARSRDKRHRQTRFLTDAPYGSL